MRKSTQVTCSGSTLTASFDTANPPLIWRFDLERNHSFTLALQGENGDWELGLTSVKGEFYPVVHFAVREDAEEAFGKIERALAKRRHFAVGMAQALLWLLLGIVAVGGGVFAFVYYANHYGHSTPIASGLTSGLSGNGTTEGVPLSADDVLKPPSP